MSSNSVSRWCTPYPPLKTARLRTVLTLSTVTVQSQCLNGVLLTHLQRLHTVLTLSTVTVQSQCLNGVLLIHLQRLHTVLTVNSDSPVTVSQWCTPYPSLKTTHSAHPVTVILVQSQCLNSVLCIHLSRLRTVLTLSTVTVQSQRLNVLFIHL